MSVQSLTTCRVLYLFMLFVTSSLAFSEAEWTLFGVRPLGMGNAFVAVADDFNALFYNPAGLARITEWEMEIINPKVDMSTNSYYLMKSLQQKSGKMSLADTLQLVDDQSGLPNYASLGLYPYFIAPGWGFAIANQTSLSFIAHKDVEIETQAISRLTIPISIATNAFSKRLSLGMSLRSQGIIGVDQDLSIDSISLFSSSSSSTTTDTSSTTTDKNKQLQALLINGYGVGVDAGLLFTPIETMQPTFGLSILDIGGTTFKKVKKDGKTPSNIPPAVNTGISFKPYKSDISYLLFALDTQLINQSSHFSHKLNLGMEWGFSKIIKIQAGLKEGYPTAGFQFDVGLLKLRLATYVVDHGTVVGLNPKLADRRVSFQIKLLI